MRRECVVLLIVGTLVMGVYLPGATTGEKTSNQYVKGRIIVGFEEGVSAESLVEAYSLNVLYKDEDLRFAVVKVEEGKELETINELKNKPGIRYAEPDYIVHAMLTSTATPNDPLWPKQWGPIAIKCPEAWDECTGSEDVVIAIIDTGVDYNHEDLSANMWHNPGETPDNGMDDDGNGYIDDYYGWDFVNNGNQPYDDEGHGTHCAGIAAAVMNNNIGIAGVVQAKIMAVKVLGRDGYGSASDVAKGIKYAADNGADVISMSLGASEGCNVLRDACQYAWDKGVVLVAAAGNDGVPDVCYPAAYDTVIAVGAINSNKKRCQWSNYGDKLELVAPGDKIFSTYPGDDYVFLSGTSMATPHVAGVAALAKAMFPSYTNRQIRDLLDTTADDLGDPGRDDYYGYGLVDATFDNKSEVTPVVKIKVHRVKALDNIDPGSRSAEWYYTIEAFSGNKEEKIINLNGQEQKWLFWYIFVWNHADDWTVDELHTLQVYEPQVKIVITLKDHDLIYDDTADISSNPERRKFIMFYDLIKDSILPNSDEVEEDGEWLLTNGEFDGSTDYDEDDAKFWFDISDNYEPPKPNLEASGDLHWDKVKPGETLTAEIYVWNAGEEDPYGWCENNLNWKIESYPDWGEWSFSPKSGQNLKPSDGKVKVSVTLVAPNERGKSYSGSIKIVNTDDPSDYKIIDVSLKTKGVKNAQNVNDLQVSFDKPLLRYILQKLGILEAFLNLISKLFNI